jgi:hypothetical protein
MRTTRLLFLTIAWAVLMVGTAVGFSSDSGAQQTSPQRSAGNESGHPGDAGRSATPPDGSHQANERASSDMRGHRKGPDTTRAASPRSFLKANRPKVLPNSRASSIPGNAMVPHQPGPNKPGHGAKMGHMTSGMANNSFEGRISSGARAAVPAINSTRHRNLAPVALGGSTKFHKSNTGTLNGSQVARRR